MSTLEVVGHSCVKQPICLSLPVASRLDLTKTTENFVSLFFVLIIFYACFKYSTTFQYWPWYDFTIKMEIRVYLLIDISIRYNVNFDWFVVNYLNVLFF